MPKYEVTHVNSDGNIEEWEIEAADLSDAQQIVLDQEEYSIKKLSE